MVRSRSVLLEIVCVCLYAACFTGDTECNDVEFSAAAVGMRVTVGFR